MMVNAYNLSTGEEQARQGYPEFKVILDYIAISRLVSLRLCPKKKKKSKHPEDIYSSVLGLVKCQIFRTFGI